MQESHAGSGKENDTKAIVPISYIVSRFKNKIASENNYTSGHTKQGEVSQTSVVRNSNDVKDPILQVIYCSCKI